MLDPKLQNEYVRAIAQVNDKLNEREQITILKEKELNKTIDWFLKEKSKILSLQTDLASKEIKLKEVSDSIQQRQEVLAKQEKMFNGEKEEWTDSVRNKGQYLETAQKEVDALLVNFSRQISVNTEKEQKIEIKEKEFTKKFVELAQTEEKLKQTELSLIEKTEVLTKRIDQFENSRKQEEEQMFLREGRLKKHSEKVLQKEQTLKKMVDEFHSLYGSKIVSLEEKEAELIERENEVRVWKGVFKKKEQALTEQESQIIDRRKVLDSSWMEYQQKYKLWLKQKETQTT